MSYSTFHNTKIACNDYSITAIREQDIYLIKEWRNAQMDILRQQNPLTDEDQKNYYQNIIKPSLQEDAPKQILVSFLKSGTCIGYGGLVHISWLDKKAEISHLMDPERIQDKELYQSEFHIYLKLLKELSFKYLKLNRIFTYAYDIRPYHTDVFDQAGFQLDARLREDVLINGSFEDTLIHSFLRSDYE